MKKLLSLLLILAMMCGAVSAFDVTAFAIEPADQLLTDVSGTYDELFAVICDPQYDQLWLDDCAAIVGEDMAPMCAEMLKAACTGTIYGEEAMAAYADAPEEASFDCYFIGGVQQFIFDGNTISGVNEAGETVFSHDYAYVQELSIAGMLDGYLYETADADAGEFRYFLLLPDTPGTTYHIEFRYGSDIDALTQYAEGPYAYWLAAGILADRDEAMVENVINLFATENLEGMGEETATDETAVIEIGTPEELLSFAKSVSDGSAGGYAGQTILLTADIDLSGVEWVPAGTMDLSDMGNYSTMFMGTFDGQGHKISNVTWASDEPVVGAGIIGMNLGTVKNLVVENSSITATDPYGMAVGCVVGYNMGMIDNVTLIGTNEVSATNAIGGIAGGSTGPVTNCVVEDVTVHVLGDNDFSSGQIVQCDVAECGGLIIGGAFGGIIDNCTAKGTVIAEGNEPVGLGGIAGCLEMMDTISNCTVDVTITSANGGHAIGGLCGYSGTHSDGMVAAETEGVIATKYPSEITNVTVKAVLDVPGATHVGGLVGTGLYYYGEETAFSIADSSVEATITDAVTPGAIAGRIVDACTFENVTANVTLGGEPLTDEIGQTTTMYESADQAA